MLGLTALLPSTVSIAVSAQQPVSLRIAAAADLQPVLPALLSGYEHATGRHAEASFASSATLATQIENGAPFDLFLSADMAFPRRIVHDGLAVADEAAQPYARGTLVLWMRKGSHLGQPGMSTLRTGSVTSIAIANPDHAPYGRAAREALTSLGLWVAVQPRLRVAENIAQAAQFVSTGNADVGLLSLSSALTLGARGSYVPVPASAYTPLVQGAVVLRRSTHPQDAAAFLHYLHTPPVSEQLRRGGLEPVPETASGPAQNLLQQPAERLP